MNSTLYGTEKQSGGIWSTLNRLLITGILCAVAVGAGVMFVPLFHGKREQDERIAELRAEAAREQAVLARRTREVELLRTDPEYVETIARDRLDMMKPGETILRFDPARPASPAAAVSAAP